MDAVPRLAEAAARRIAAGALDGEKVDSLARDLGVSERQLRRALQRELGVSPIELAQTHRLLLAKQLLAETSMTLAQVAFTSGFQSLRRFNALFRARYRLNPAAMRRGAHRPGAVRLTLAYRPPLAWTELLDSLRAWSTPGVEHIDGGSLTRTVEIDGRVGVIRVERGARDPAATLDLEISDALVPVVMRLLPRVRALLDLDAEPASIDGHLRAAGLDASVRERPGLRVPGAFDGFEVAVRALVGQGIGATVATRCMGRLVAAFGRPFSTREPLLTHLAPTAMRVAAASVAEITAAGLPRPLAVSVRALAGLVAAGSLRLDADADIAASARRMRSVPGMAGYTAEMIVMRAIGWPDAFPAGDPSLLRAAGGASTEELFTRAERWRPWRAYGAMHLWAEASA